MKMPLRRTASIDDYFAIFGDAKVGDFLGMPLYKWQITPELIFDVLDSKDGTLFIQWIHSSDSFYNCLADVLNFLPPEMKNKFLFNLDLFV